jgi:hypothetical protein
LINCQDFLKCIHHFASQYYGSRRELFDSAGAYRKVKRENRKRRMLRAARSRSKDPETRPDERESDEGEKHTDNDSSTEISPTSKAQRKRKGKAKTMSGSIVTPQKDMYKALDGSALLCIGTLIFRDANLVILILNKRQGHYFRHILRHR